MCCQAHLPKKSDRVAALVSVERTGLLRRQSIEVDLPDEAAINERWKRDGIDLSLASAGTGRRAWALRKLVESAPLYAWEIATGLTPERTVEALQSSPVVSELTDGWCAATLREGDPSWANALCSTPGNSAWRAAAALCAEDANRHVKMVLGAPKPVEAGLHGLLGAVAGKLHSDTIDALIDWFGTDSNQWVGVDAIGLWFTNANSTQMGLLLRRFEPDDPRHKQIRHLEAARSLRDAILKEFP